MAVLSRRTVAVALVGGLWPGVSGAVSSSLLLNFFFTPPVGPSPSLTQRMPLRSWSLSSLQRRSGSSSITLLDVLGMPASQEPRRRCYPPWLAMLSVQNRDLGPPGRLSESFGQDAVALVERDDSRSPWSIAASVGDQPPTRSDQAETTVPIDEYRALLLKGRPLDAGDRRVLDAFAAHTVALLDRDRLRTQAAKAERLAEADDLRNAILAAVSHDVRTPLAAIKAGISGMRQPDVTWSPKEREELMATIEDGADRLDSLLSNLLDLSRLQSGAVRPREDEVDVADIVANAADELDAPDVVIDLPETLPEVVADAGLVERILANVLDNASRFSPPGVAIRVLGFSDNSSVRILVVDQGPGVLDRDKDRMFAAFQRLGDSPDGTGLGLGLAVAKGFAVALGGDLEAEDTPGGGLTMVLTLPSAPEHTSDGTAAAS